MSPGSRKAAVVTGSTYNRPPQDPAMTVVSDCYNGASSPASPLATTMSETEGRAPASPGTSGGAAGTPSKNGGGRSPTSARSRSKVGTVIAIVVVIGIVTGGLGYYYGVVRPSQQTRSSMGVNQSLEMGGFDSGQVVTFLYNGTTTSTCTPSLTSFFPNDPNASAATKYTNCEVGAASQNAVPQVPEYVLVPAFAGLSIFGVAALGANASGFPTLNGSALATDCGAGGTATACPDHPTFLYSPLFTAVEEHLGLSHGYGGLPEGVLPTPAHDHLINTPTTYPNVYWGTTVVLVLDPNIFPDRETASCSVVSPSNLSNPTSNCLSSFAGLERALTTCSSSAAAYNSATKNPIWQTLVSVGVSSCAQVYVPGGVSALNANLYIPFSVSPGDPPMFPE